MSKNILLFLSLNMAACAMEPAGLPHKSEWECSSSERRASSTDKNFKQLSADYAPGHYTTYACAMEPTAEPKTPLYLVVGSVRTSKMKERFPHAQLWKEDKADLTHLKTYNGKATTLDLQKSDLPNAKHLVGDVRTYDFSKHIIAAAYLERLQTLRTMNLEQLACVPMGSERKYMVPQNYKNHMGDCIISTRRYMAPGSTIKIHWQPDICLYLPDGQTPVSLCDKQSVKVNPFAGFINIALMDGAIQMAYDKEMPKDLEAQLPKTFLACVHSTSKTFKEIIAFYAQKGVGTEKALIERIEREFWLWNILNENNELVALTHGPSASLEDFSRAVDRHCRFPKQPADLVLSKGCLRWKELTALFGNEKFTVYDANDIFDNSLFAFMLSEAVVMHNAPYVKEFMENNGFKDVTIKRTKSEENGRENVWIIEGTSNESSA